MSRPTYVRGEVLAPLSQTPGTTERTSDEHLNLIASWLDDRFVVPGIGIRFGVDALIGWIPGIGDALAAFASLFIVWAGWKRGSGRKRLICMPIDYDVQSDFGVHVRFYTNHRRSRPCGVESESPQLQPAHPGPAIPASAHMARLVICRSGDSDDVSSLPRPIFAPDLPAQVAYSALLSLTESL